MEDQSKMVRSEGDRLRRVVMCSPRLEFQKAKNDPTHNIGDVSDTDKASRQHDKLKECLSKFGVQIIDAEEMPGHPNSVFTRDTATSTPNGYINLQLGLPTRVGENTWMANIIDKIGRQCAGKIVEPGTVEGGDVVLAGHVAFVGLTQRTNEEGIRQLSGLLIPLGYEMRVIRLPDTVLHLDKALMTLGGNRVLYCNDLVKPEELQGFEGLPITSGANATANIICLGDNEVIVNESNTTVHRMLEDLGFIVHILDLSEFAKGMGGPNCLIMPLERG